MNILFVCTGNTCRSAMAEYLLRTLAADVGATDIAVRSCGIAASVGAHEPSAVVQAMKREGIDITGHRPTQMTEELLAWADVVLGMEHMHCVSAVMFSPENAHKVHLLKKYIDASEPEEIGDPWGSSPEAYQDYAEELKDYCTTLLEKIRR
jgi:protein-tyrosine-phosphatase